MPGYKFLDITSDELSGMIAEESLIGLDTEFMREKTFHPQLCLVQVSTRDAICCADPLIPKDDERETQIWSQLLKRAWVVHSARQDVEVIYQTTGQIPTELFDTQIAAALLGYPPQMGYANLVEELFGEKLAKSHTRADWSHRPLADAVRQFPRQQQPRTKQHQQAERKDGDPEGRRLELRFAGIDNLTIGTVQHDTIGETGRND